MVKAPKDETGLEPSALGSDLSLSTRSISGKSRSCTARERTVKYRPAQTTSGISK